MTELREILDEIDDADAPAGLDLARELEIATADPQEPEAHREHFMLTEPRHFDWAGRKLAAARAEVERLEHWKAEDLAKRADKFDRHIASAKREAQGFEAWISGCVFALPAVKGRRHIKTPHLSASVIQDHQWIWPETSALLEWAKTVASGVELTRLSEIPDKAAIKTYVKETGERPPGLEISERERVRLVVAP